MSAYFGIRYSHREKASQQPPPLQSLVQQMEGFTFNHDLAHATPRYLKKFDRLSLDEISEQVDSEWNSSLTTLGKAQAEVPRRFDFDYQEHHDEHPSDTLRDFHRRHSEPQEDALCAGRCHQRRYPPRCRQRGPLTKLKPFSEWNHGRTPADWDDCEMPSPHNSFFKESRVTVGNINDGADEGSFRLEQLNRKVLLAMERQSLGRRGSSVETSLSTQRRDSEQTRAVVEHEPPLRSALASQYIPSETGKPPYQPLTRPEDQIRLFRLERTTKDSQISGSFIYSDIKSCPKYTALSYAWGEPTKTRKITVDGRDDFEIAENLWWFFHCRNMTKKKSRLFWIDAICIDQDNVFERNHQVGLMKQIYSVALNVYIWLGRESENSRLAMDCLSNEGAKPLQRRDNGYRPIWSRQQGKAIRELCERPYWTRMWIIQEIIHANRITVWCGSQHVDWPVMDKLYLTMKTLEEDGHLASHEFVSDVLQSPAFVMLWQRAHWRHPETPTPKLQTLIKIFQGWECTDVRDKVYALVSMADQETTVVPDYSRSSQQIYHDVLSRGVSSDHRFCKLLARVLGYNPDSPDQNFDQK